MRLWPRAGSPRAAGWAVAAGVFVLYWLTFSPIPTSDGYTYIRSIESGDYARILFANSMLTTYAFFLLRSLFLGIGLPVPTLAIVQAANAASAALSALLFYRILLLLGGGPFWGIVGAGLLAGSYGFWYFANGEMHHLAMVFVLLVFYLLLRRRVLELPITPAFVSGVALLNVAAGFFHQEHFAFGLTALALLMVGRPWRQGARDAAIYTGAGIAGSAAVLLLMGGGVLRLKSLDAIRRWYFWQLDRPLGEFVAEHPVVVGARVVKGQLTAWLFGTQVLADAVRRPELLRDWRVPALAGLTLLAYGAAAWLLWQGGRSRRARPAWFVLVLVAASAWFLSYPVLFGWYFPAVTEYYLKTVPPLVLLLLLGAVAAEPRAAARGTAVVLLLLALAVNVSSAIWPWHRYGQVKEGLRRDFYARFSPDDLFISFESGIDYAFREQARFFGLKGLFDRQGREKGFRAVRDAIDEQLARRGRVFAYNLVPAPFSLATLNAHLEDPRVERYRREEFEAFVEELRREYVLSRVLLYWEETQEPLYLYGRNLQPMWELRRKDP